jgi:excisionase family DNA binding protein
VTQLTVKEAADKVGVTRQWLFRLIREGKLSATLSRDGKKQIDVSELIRVFGELQQSTPDISYSVDKRSLSPKLANSSTTTALQIELERLKSALDFKQAELALAVERIQELKDRELQVKERERDLADERNRLIGIIEQQNRLLSAPEAKVVKKVAKPKSKAGSR